MSRNGARKQQQTQCSIASKPAQTALAGSIQSSVQVKLCFNTKTHVCHNRHHTLLGVRGGALDGVQAVAAVLQHKQQLVRCMQRSVRHNDRMEGHIHKHKQAKSAQPSPRSPRLPQLKDKAVQMQYNRRYIPSHPHGPSCRGCLRSGRPAPGPRPRGRPRPCPPSSRRTACRGRT